MCKCIIIIIEIMKKRSSILIYPFLLIAMLLMFTNSCKEKNEGNNTNIVLDVNNNSLNTVTDFDGNVYQTVTIGTQVWMVENLKTTHYTNGDPIPNVIDSTIWQNLTTGAYCNYNNDPINAQTYGRLYNWYTVSDIRKIAPIGWHMPTNAECTILTDYLSKNGYGHDGHEISIGKSMAATSGWFPSPYKGDVGNDQASNNSSGFTGLPSGYRNDNGAFFGIGAVGFWLSSSEHSSNVAWNRCLSFFNFNVLRPTNNKHLGLSVRCLKDF